MNLKFVTFPLTVYKSFTGGHSRREDQLGVLIGEQMTEMTEQMTERVLEAAAVGDAPRLQQLLLEMRGVDPNSLMDEGGFTALLIGADRGHEAVVKVLLDAKSNPNTRAEAGGTTGLMRAAMNGHTAVAASLLERKADAAISSSSGDNGELSPVFAAHDGGHTRRSSDVLLVSALLCFPNCC